MHPDPLRAIRYIVAGEDLVHGSEREGPRTGAGAFENPHVRGGGNADLSAIHLHLAVELTAGNSGDLDLGIQQTFEFRRRKVIRDRPDVPALGKQLYEEGAGIRIWISV